MTPLFPEDDLAIAAIWAESRGEPYEAQVGVGEVIRTRTRLKFQSDGTVTGTVLHPYAFSSFNTTDPNRLKLFRIYAEDPVVASCAKAWDESKTSTLTAGATSYYSVDIPPPKWAVGLTPTAEIGHFRFYLLRS